MSSPNTVDNIWSRLKSAVKGVAVGNAYALLADDATFGGFPKYYLDPVNGNDANTGLSPSAAKKTLAAAYALTTSGKNESIILIGNGAASGTLRVDATFTWAKDATHLIGVCSPVLFSPRARIAPTGATTAFANFFTINANGCIFSNIQWFHGFNTGTAAMIAMTINGSRNYFNNCHLAGMGDAASAADVGSRSLKIGSSGSGENVFEDCVIGLDTVTRTVANASVELAGGTPRNVFRRCILPFFGNAAGVLGILGTGNGCVDRFNVFEACQFLNAIKSTSVQMDALLSFTTASPGGAIVFKNCHMIGITKFGDTNGLANSYIDMAAPSTGSGGLSVNPS